MGQIDAGITSTITTYQFKVCCDDSETAQLVKKKLVEANEKHPCFEIKTRCLGGTLIQGVVHFFDTSADHLLKRTLNYLEKIPAVQSIDFRSEVCVGLRDHFQLPEPDSKPDTLVA